MALLTELLAFVSLALLVLSAWAWLRDGVLRRRVFMRAGDGRAARAPASGTPPTTRVRGEPARDSLPFPRFLLGLAGRLEGWAVRLAGHRALEAARRILSWAGRPGGLGPERLLGLQAASGLVGLASGLLLWAAGPGGPWITIGTTTAGCLAPALWVRRIARRRQARLGRDLPDLLDLLAVALGAGAGLDAALSAVVSRLEGPLAEEFRRYLTEVALGASRRDALFRLRERNDCRDLDWLVATLAQAHALGVPLAGVLATEASHLRRIRLARAREQAARAGPRITLVTTFVATPGALVFFLGLLLLSVWKNPAEFGLTGILFGP
ncbi:type II secretion system F family protein [Caldinitratiruptor microaerophilus]|uniref:Type II secretion system protein GspF domain-containing protein n=1 Tax=Caldinitratiruptor microaerophilus TaxID=671077 RepID=A0AA35CIZ5_9FIRM|nr:type II secretion system F family protein [Caldinitratiruptor microaerophilus]BDG59932.1 hypothetical protein caldi_10220 [Caldinitratiruptor microaerophilus]